MVRYAPAVLRARNGSPTPHLRREPRLFQINRRLASEIVLTALFRQMFFMRAPTHFRRLASFGIKAVYGPCVHELVHLLRLLRRLRVAFRDVNDFNLKFLCERRPLLTRLRFRNFFSGIFCDSQKCLFDEMRYQPRVCAVRDNCRRPRARDGQIAQNERLFAERVVGALRHGKRRVGVITGPRLNDRVQIQDSLFLAELDEVGGRNSDRDVAEEISLSNVRQDYFFVIVRRERLKNESHAEFFGDRASALVGGNDGNFLRRHREMPEEERKDALSDASKTDNQNFSVKFLLRHFIFLSLNLFSCRYYWYTAYTCDVNSIAVEFPICNSQFAK